MHFRLMPEQPLLRRYRKRRKSREREPAVCLFLECPFPPPSYFPPPRSIPPSSFLLLLFFSSNSLLYSLLLKAPPLHTVCLGPSSAEFNSATFAHIFQKEKHKNGRGKWPLLSMKKVLLVNFSLDRRRSLKGPRKRGGEGGPNVVVVPPYSPSIYVGPKGGRDRPFLSPVQDPTYPRTEKEEENRNCCLSLSSPISGLRGGEPA